MEGENAPLGFYVPPVRSEAGFQSYIVIFLGFLLSSDTLIINIQPLSTNLLGHVSVCVRFCVHLMDERGSQSSSSSLIPITKANSNI